ncbi:MAG: hypothetical protein V7641_2034 [Blastocatellia bacterium]
MLQDLRYSLRMLGKSPAFTLVAVFSLAIGIGANTTVFSIVNALLLRPLPGINEPSRLADLHATSPYGQFGTLSYPDYEYYRDHNHLFEGIAAYSFLEAYINAGDQPEHAMGNIVSGNYFSVLGARPAAGRFFSPEEDQTPDAQPVVVIGYSYWQRRFGGDPQAVGRAITLNNHSYTIIGVAQENFRGTVVAFSPDIWVPLTMRKAVMPGELVTRNSSWLQSFGRLPAGVSIEQAQAELVTLAEQLQQAYPETNRDRGIRLQPSSALPGAVRGPVVGFMGILMAIVGLVLLIACANVAAMFLTRTTARRKEIAIRLAMGATRGRIIRQVIIESLVLFLLGGAAGTLFAMWATNLLASVQLPFDMPIFIDLGLDWRVLGFTLLASLVTGVLFGLSPALQASKPDLLSALKSDTLGGGAHRSRTRNAFVIAQVAISLVLLIVGGLFLRSLMNAAHIEPGFNPDGVQTVGYNLRIQGYDEARGREFYRQLVEQIEATPGVRSASLAQLVPLTGNVMAQGIRVEGIEPPPGREFISVDCNVVDARYSQTLEVPLQRGRWFSETDKQGAPLVAVVNETFARRFFPDTDAVGKRFTLDKDAIEIIGIARDGKYETLGEEPTPYFYLPFAQSYSSGMTLHIRAAPTDAAAVFAAVRQITQRLDKNLPLLNVMPMTEQIGFSLIPLRLASSIVSVLGLVGLALAAIGIFGVVSYSVAQRTREIGIRMALGAERRDVLRLVLGQGLKLALIGVVIGLVMSFTLTRALASLLYGISASDPLVFVTMALALSIVALAASYLPARRATRVDPMIALRYE